jgi:glycosyltransferase involved in cell wall biosynthesis
MESGMSVDHRATGGATGGDIEGHPRRRVFLISQRFGQSAGGEAVKAHQYADFLLAQGHDVTVFTHARTLGHGMALAMSRLRTTPDSALQRVLWRLPLLRGLLGTYFHFKIRGLVLDEALKGGAAPVLHYISPVSPVALRFPPQGFEVVLGPLTGNIYYPPAFRTRMSLADRFRERLHALSQVVFRRLAPEKPRMSRILVSGYERTRASLRLAGANEDQMLDVVDAGVSGAIFARPRLTHQGENLRFVCSGRLVDHKAIDLAIRALARADAGLRLDIYGDGERRAALEALVRDLGLQGRVEFKGWLTRHEDLLDALRAYRGYVFPSLAEANGIAMQEAMAMGLPVITLKWGGPAMLADDDSTLFVMPDSEEAVVAGIAMAMNRLAQDPSLAESLSIKARARAEQLFTWDAVAESWQKAYRPHMSFVEPPV